MPFASLKQQGTYDSDVKKLSDQVSRLEDNVLVSLKSLALQAADRLIPTNTKTSDYVAKTGELVAAGSSLNVTLPAPSALISGLVVGVSVQAGTVTVVTVGGLVQGAASDSLTTVGAYLYVCDGIGWWRAPTSAGGTPAVSVVTETSYGQASAVGASLLYARQDHTHGTPASAALTPAATVVSETAFGVASAVGVSTNYARQDHTHGTPATPVTSAVAGTGVGVSAATGAVTFSITPAASVVTEQAYGQASAVGVSTNTARQDHTHGTPATPVTSAVAGTNVTVSGATGAVTINAKGGLLRAPQIFTTNGTCTHPTGTQFIRVRLVGGGGGGGGVANSAAAQIALAGGGGSGGYAEHMFTSAAATTTVVVGAGGSGGANTGANGGAGNNSTATHNGTTITALGGNGGAFSATSATAAFVTGGAGVSNSTGANVNGGGDIGGYGYRVSGTLGVSGGGGSSLFGGGAIPRFSATAGAGAAAAGIGSGGAGALSSNASGAVAGGAGSTGICIIEEYS